MKFTTASIAALSVAFATTAFARPEKPESPGYGYYEKDPSGYEEDYHPEGYGYYEKDPSYYPSYYQKKKAKAPKKPKAPKKAKGPAKGKSDRRDGGGDCAAVYCDTFFKKANKYYYDRNLAGYSDYDDYYAKDAFTREDCQWDPAAYYGPQCEDLDEYQNEACHCYWTYEVQCKTNLETKPYKDGVKPYESELALAQDVKYAIENDKVYGKLFTDCFDDDIYDCLCSFHDDPPATDPPATEEPHQPDR